MTNFYRSTYNVEYEIVGRFEKWVWVIVRSPHLPLKGQPKEPVTYLASYFESKDVESIENLTPNL